MADRGVRYEPLTEAELAEDRASLVGQRLDWRGREAAYVRVNGRIVGVVYRAPVPQAAIADTQMGLGGVGVGGVLGSDVRERGGRTRQPGGL